jgi:hypothetical protein
MKGLWRRAEAILRGHPGAGTWQLVLGCGLAYGGVMGAFAGRPGQMAISAIKLPLLLVATLLLSLPSYFVLNTLLGLRSDFAAAWRAVVASQAGLTIILVSLAPLTAFWYASSSNYRFAIFFNALMFAVASVAAQALLRRSYQPLIDRDPKHRWLLRIWIFLYAFVGIQMGYNLRPFIGAPDAPVGFFRGGGWENAYVVVARMLWDALTK